MKKQKKNRLEQIEIYLQAGFTVIDGKIMRFDEEHISTGKVIQLCIKGEVYNLSKSVFLYYFENKELIHSSDENITKFLIQNKFTGYKERVPRRVKIRKGRRVIYPPHPEYGSLYNSNQSAKYCPRCNVYDGRMVEIANHKQLCNRCSQICRGDEYSTSNVKSLFFNCKVVVKDIEYILTPNLKLSESFLSDMISEGYTYMLKERHTLDMKPIERKLLIKKNTNSN